MKYNKLKAFTIAEVMVLLLTLSILAAAFAPVFTTRYTGGATDDVWTFVQGDDHYDAYFDVANKNHSAMAFIGITPATKVDVPMAIRDSANTSIYSKVVIRASNSLGAQFGNQQQNQMSFRYGDSAAGDLVGTLYTGNSNMMLGGIYEVGSGKVLEANTSFGSGSLNSLGSGSGTVYGNTAIGSEALNSLTGGDNNTAVGLQAGMSVKSGDGNTFVGYMAGKEAGSSAAYNTVIGSEAGTKVSGKNNVAVGTSAMQKLSSGDSNVAVGSYSLSSATTGSNNTAVGYNALKNLERGSYNTAIGVDSCLSNTGGSYVTCVGGLSGSPFDRTVTSKYPSYSSSINPSADIFSGSSANDEVVLIGSVPMHQVTNKSAAILEVHNNKSINNNLSPIPGGNESVVVNGNLVVRGRSFFETPMLRPNNLSISGQSNFSYRVPKGLVAYTLIGGSGTNAAFGGWDGYYRESKSKGKCDRRCKTHASKDARPNCVCTSTSDTTKFEPHSSNTLSSTSYDWSTPATGKNIFEIDTCDFTFGTYKDKSTGKTITLERRGPDESKSLAGPEKFPGTDLNYAHGYLGTSLTCCPDLKSDRRLKNVGEKFTAGLDELRRLNVYNFTFKNDANQLPHVGVIAQDLKRVFPNSVTKGDDGYYRIRWDEMFYAAINSIKTLNTKIEKLASKIVTDKERVAALKRDNDKLNDKLDSLIVELDILEAKRAK